MGGGGQGPERCDNTLNKVPWTIAQCGFILVFESNLKMQNCLWSFMAVSYEMLYQKQQHAMVTCVYYQQIQLSSCHPPILTSFLHLLLHSNP